MSAVYLETAFGYRAGKKDRPPLLLPKSAEDSDFRIQARVTWAAGMGLP